MRIKGSIAKGLLVALAFTLIPASAISAQKVSAGSVCKVQKQKVTYKNKVYKCVKSGKKLVWNKGVVVQKPTPTPKPTPKTTQTPTPDRKRVVEGKRVRPGVDLGGRRII